MHHRVVEPEAAGEVVTLEAVPGQNTAIFHMFFLMLR